MKIAVVGTGAMGSVYAALLAEAGNEVWAVDTWAEHIRAIQENGLCVEGKSGDRTLRLNATTDPAEVGPCEPADADAIAGLRLERERLRLEVRDRPDAEATDTRQVRIIELGVRIYQLSREAKDLSAAHEDIRRYLAQPDAPRADRVRELERELGDR